MKMSQMLMMATALIMAVMPILAETGAAESPDFTVNTVPEPAVLIAVVGALLLARRSKRGIMCVLLTLLVGSGLPLLAAPPVVTNVTAQQQAWPSFLVDIHYDVSDVEGHTQIVSVAISTNSGVHYNIVSTNLTGDIGAGIPVGTNKHIIWNAGMDLPGLSSATVRVKISAEDGIVPPGMALIPAGSFTMGDTFAEGGSNELPLHSVYISAFYMDKYEVSYTQWTNVYTWATNHYYTFNNAGSGKATNHPVHTVNWYDCVKWCNARSEKEGLTPCYYTDAAQTQTCRTGQTSLSNNWVNWTANGYRLPTEAEWEKAARGGTPGHRFPWSDVDTIQHAQANYYSHTNQDGTAMFSYDTSPTRGCHPTFATGGYPYTSPAGYFAPNGYGLYDMAGNVCEWTWDWYDGAWYNHAGATQSDTPGPANGTFRVLRGGVWLNIACFSRVAYRYGVTPDGTSYGIGFRSVRR